MSFNFIPIQSKFKNKPKKEIELDKNIENLKFKIKMLGKKERELYKIKKEFGIEEHYKSFHGHLTTYYTCDLCKEIESLKRQNKRLEKLLLKHTDLGNI